MIWHWIVWVLLWKMEYRENFVRSQKHLCRIFKEIFLERKKCFWCYANRLYNALYMKLVDQLLLYVDKSKLNTSVWKGKTYDLLKTGCNDCNQILLQRILQQQVPTRVVGYKGEGMITVLKLQYLKISARYLYQMKQFIAPTLCTKPQLKKNAGSWLV